MLFLSNAALRYAVDICLEKDNYKVGIAVIGEDKRNTVQQMILDMVTGSDYIESVKNSKYNFRIDFKNGSCIKLIYASDNSRGNRLHLLIADKEISIDVMNNVLKRCELLDWYEYSLKQRAIQNGLIIDDLVGL